MGSGSGAGSVERSHRETCLLAALHQAEALIAKLNYYSDRAELTGEKIGTIEISAEDADDTSR